MPTHRKRLDMNQKKYKRSATDLQRRSSPAAIFVITVVAAGTVFVGWKAIAPLSRDTTTDVTVPRLCPSQEQARRRSTPTARLCQRTGGPRLDQPVPGVLQPPETSIIAWRAGPRSGISHDAAANPGRSITKADIHLATAPKLFRQAEPPLGVRSPASHQPRPRARRGRRSRLHPLRPGTASLSPRDVWSSGPLHPERRPALHPLGR